MAALFETIKLLVSQDRYVIGLHASERLEERSIMEWQVVAGLASGTLLQERPEAKPNPVAEVQQALADGTPIKAIWSHLSVSGVAKLVTVHFLDRE